MSFVDDISNLDPNDVGRWPLPFRIAGILLAFLLVAGLGTYQTVYKDKMVTLEREKGREGELKRTFEGKQRKAANYDEYLAQLGEMERSFGAMLRQLPGQTEIPNLIIDISQTGLAAGLEEKLFEPQDETRKDFYAEKPIKIRLEGSFHEFANFASSVAALPRIVTLHDIKIAPKSSGDFDELTLNVTAKTYRYLEEEEVL